MGGFSLYWLREILAKTEDGKDGHQRQMERPAWESSSEESMSVDRGYLRLRPRIGNTITDNIYRTLSVFQILLKEPYLII